MVETIAQKIDSLKSSLPPDITLVAVSKTKPVSDILEAYEAGQRHFGENKVQEMEEKFGQLPKDICWHMIGHVQGNKIKYMAPFVHLVHGIDKEKRLKELNKEAKKNNRVIDCLLQVHIAQEETKFGFDAPEIRALFHSDFQIKYPNVRVRGLMGMATFTEDENEVSREFKGLYKLYSESKKQLELEHFDILSMGMSGDYKLAIVQGGTHIRVGSAIFGSR